ncbi:MAG: nitroreductase family protein [Lachnospiraceae bacterium]|jgi:hypothetical protein|nr:nitroreductase family protein [Lachnospiraceae bacterium]
MKDFLQSLEDRRTCYAISDKSPVSDERIEEIVKHCVKHVPSAFNMQSGKVLLLLNENHKALWDIVMEALRKIVPAEKFAPTEEKINSFAAGHGTILYFDDTEITNGLAEKFAAYKDNFPVWAQHANGMLQHAIWCALKNEGLGASLQHYNPLIDDEVSKKWDVPKTWKLIAQMPFGEPTAEPGPKEFAPIEERLKVYK